MRTTAKTIAEFLGGIIEGDPNVVITKASKIEEAEIGSISFLANPKYESHIYTTKASAILVNLDFKPKQKLNCTLIKVKNAYIALGMLLEKYQQDRRSSFTGISEQSFIHKEAKIGEKTAIGHHSVISENAVLGNNCIIHSQVFVGRNVVLGNNVVLYPGVKIYDDCNIGDNCTIHANTVIGADGFGFAPQHDGSYRKMPQVGNVVIESDVEIGANTTIDRATMGSTIIRKGVKIDNLVQIAHNVEIGENTVIAAQAGIAGSTKIGKNCMVGGQVGFVGHLKIADGSKFQAQSGVAASIKKEGMSFFGYPAIPYNEYIKSYAVFKKLPDLYKKIHQLEQKLKDNDKDTE